MNTAFVSVWSGNYGVFKAFPTRAEALEHANLMNKVLIDTSCHPYIVMTEEERAAVEAEQSAWERDYYRSLSNEECIRYGIG